MQKIWVCGARGQIGQAVNDVVDKLEFEMLDTDVDDLDVTDTDEVLRFGEMNRPDIIINCSGMTDISSCEENPSQAFKVNALGARNLAIVAAKMQAKMVQLSTDDVFDGKSTEPYTEFDITNPGTVYGKSKLAGENYVKEFTTKHFIVRSTWVYGKGQNFINGFLKKVDAGEQLFDCLRPVWITDERKRTGKIFITSYAYKRVRNLPCDEQGRVQPLCDFAQEILKMTGKTASMQPVPTVMSDFSKVRPAYAVLDNFIMSMVPIYDFPDWQDSLREYLEERGLYHAE